MARRVFVSSTSSRANGIILILGNHLMLLLGSCFQLLPLRLHKPFPKAFKELGRPSPLIAQSKETDAAVRDAAMQYSRPLATLMCLPEVVYELKCCRKRYRSRYMYEEIRIRIHLRRELLLILKGCRWLQQSFEIPAHPCDD